MKKIFLFFVTIFIISCTTNDEPIEKLIDYDTINETEIQEYLIKNNLDAEKSDSGLYYIIHNTGAGNSPISSSNVTVNYKGYFLDNQTFDEQSNIELNLSQVIPGFSEGLQYLKEGGEATLIIPSKLAYKDLGILGIPAGSVLIFDVDLLAIN